MDKQTNIDRLCECFLQTVHQFGRLEKEMHTYGTEQKLHLSETHTIAAVGSYDAINITNLAKLQGVSRSAASQMVSRLVKKDFIQKKISPKTENEVVLSLTKNGKKVWQWHEKQHVWLREKLTSIFAEYPGDTLVQLQSLMEKMQAVWKRIPEQIK